MPDPRVVVAGALVVAALMTMAGCTGDDAPGSGTAPVTASASAVTNSAPPTLRAAAPALQDLTVTTCPSGTGRLEATGDLRNYGTVSGDYVVTVTWLDADSSVVDSAFAVVQNLASRQQKSWQVTGTLDKMAASCTTRVTRGRI